MLIKDLEKLRKRTLRERIYEEIVHLILSGELPSRGLHRACLNTRSRSSTSCG
jgi:hypothetical protein